MILSTKRHNLRVSHEVPHIMSIYCVYMYIYIYSYIHILFQHEAAITACSRAFPSFQYLPWHYPTHPPDTKDAAPIFACLLCASAQNPRCGDGPMSRTTPLSSSSWLSQPSGLNHPNRNWNCSSFAFHVLSSSNKNKETMLNSLALMKSIE